MSTTSGALDRGTGQGPGPCACECDEAAPPAAGLYNRPGLPQLAYRVADYAVFFARMKAHALRHEAGDGGGGPAPRFSDNLRDPALALIDAWAVALDVLTFYQERIANEGYLRTATEARSVRELARMVGYELRPGVAASTFLSFTVDESPGSPEQAAVPAGAQVQSLPAQGGLPQTFETVTPLVARQAWNRLRPVTSQPTRLRQDQGDLVLVGEGGGSIPASHLLLQGNAVGVKAGDLLLLHLPGEDRPRPARVLAVFAEGENTRVVLGGDPADPLVPPPFGEPAPEPVKLPEDLWPLTVEMVRDFVWDTRLTEAELQGLLRAQGWDAAEFMTHVDSLRRLMQAAGVPRVYVLRKTVAPFGASAPRYDTLPHDPKTNPYPVSWDGPQPPTVWQTSQGADLGGCLHLELPVPEVVAGGWIVCEAPSASSALPGALDQQVFRVQASAEVTRVDFGISVRATAVYVDRKDGDGSGRFRVRQTTVWAQSEELALAELPVTAPVPDPAPDGGGTGDADREVVLGQMVLGLAPGQPVALSGQSADTGLPVGEVAVLAEVSHLRGRTRLRFQGPLGYSYARQGLTLCANVVPATHGETVEEVLGSGDGGQAGQRFTLRRPPLTYLPGPQSTLEVRVGGVRWREVPSLEDEGPESRSYTVRGDEGGAAEVRFGDGVHGARLPTGSENVTARYRTGSGLDGEVQAGGLQLMVRPPAGIRDVRNPVPATGAANPETLAGAREAAPRSTRHTGRLVSLADYAALCINFPGIEKAQADLLIAPAPSPGLPRPRVVYLTVAGAGGGDVPDGSALQKALLRRINGSRDLLEQGRLQVRAQGAERILFRIRAQVRVAPDYQQNVVFAAVRDALSRTFSFARRALAQPLIWSEVVAAIQGVPGVVATNVVELSVPSHAGSEDGVKRTGADCEAGLPALPARWDSGGARFQPAQLLLLNPDWVDLSPLPGLAEDLS